MNSTQTLAQARWIWPYQRFHGLRNVFADMRRDFELGAVPESVPFAITADQRYDLWVNGEYVHHGPARGYVESWPYDEIDLAPFLRANQKNWISVRAYNGGVSTFQYIHAFSAGMLCAGQVGEVSLNSGDNWWIRGSRAHRRDLAKKSYQLDFQESFDARLDDESWIHSPDFSSEGWHFDGGQIYGHLPWHEVEPRQIPLLGRDIVAYANQVGATTGTSAEGWETAENLFSPIYAEIKAATFEPTAGAGADLVFPPIGPDLYRAVLLDLGRPGVGAAIVEASGPAGTIVDLFFSEAVRPDGRPVIGTTFEAGCEAAMVSRLVLREGVTRHEFFHPIGHRIAMVVVRGNSAPVTVDLKLRETLYPLAVKGSFQTSDLNMSEIYRICTQTQRVCMLDAYVDTPWREQAQWWGDARVQSQNTFHLANDTRLLRRGIRSIARQYAPDGLTFGHAPTMAYNCVLPDFSLIWMLTLYDDYFQSGEPTMVVEMQNRIEELLVYFEGPARGQHGLLRYDPRYWLFLDWADIRHGGTPTLLNLWFILACERVAEVARVAELAAFADRLTELASLQRRLVDEHLWSEELGLYLDGMDSEGTPVNRASIHTQTLAILAGMRPDQHASFIEKRLLPYLSDEPLDSSLPSSYWVSYVYDVLERSGYGAEVVAHIRRKWSPMIPYEGCWEVFSGADYEANIGQESTTHAWAAHPIFHFARTVGGIRQTAPGWKEITFAPIFPAVTSDIKVEIPSPLGIIRSEWQRTPDGIAVELSLPTGVTAKIELPGRPSISAEGVKTWQLSI